MKGMGPMRILGVILIVFGIVTIIGGAVAGSATVERTISDRYGKGNSVGDMTTWSCGTADPVQVGRVLRDDVNHQSYAEHEGSAYLRTRNRIIVVGRTAGECTIRAESLDRTYSNGGYIFLGPGFRPGSPASGSGGNSGSWGGAK